MPLLKPFYAFTLFLSAFLLFAAQPMIGKALLPLLGGGPSVWNTAMLFFQVLLLAGYAYAFILSKIPSLKVQGLLHLGLLIGAAALSLPLALKPDSLPPADAPRLWQLMTMCSMIAAPFFILSATAPLLQRWFSLTDHPEAHAPYTLYTASNTGSFLALFLYPFSIERLLRLGEQASWWTYGYAALAIACIAVFIASFRNRPPMQTVIDDTSETDIKPSFKDRLGWVFLAFIPSSLMLGYTTFVTTDVTSAPLFWIVPLALYLASFIMAFAADPWLKLETTRSLQATFILFFLWFIMVGVGSSRMTILIIHGGLFFLTALMCHQELARRKPSPRYLTEFFLFLSLGGALGGFFNSIIAPLIFKLPYEYPLVIILGVFARFMYDNQSLKSALHSAGAMFKRGSGTTTIDFVKFPGLIVLGASTALIDSPAYNVLIATIVVIGAFSLNERRWAFALTLALIFLSKPLIPWDVMTTKMQISRNYYGVHMVEDAPPVRKMTHGTTVHGAQALDPEYATTSITYYHKQSGAQDLFEALGQKAGAQKVAALGLGIGSVACFSKTERSFDFYEIDPAVVKIAQDERLFTYLRDCKSPYKIIMGDARQKLAEAPDQSYDMIFADVFSSDNVPVHILTQEAIALYLTKLKPDGLLVFHTSNRYFNLEPEIALIADKIGIPHRYRLSQGSVIDATDLPAYPTKYIVLTQNKDALRYLDERNWITIDLPLKLEPWSDDYANLLRAIRF